MFLKNIIFKSFLVSISFATTYPMESNTDKMLNGIDKLDVSKVQDLIKKIEYGDQDIKKFFDKLEKHEATYHSGGSEGETFGQALMLAGFIAIVGIIIHSIKDVEVPKILDSKTAAHADGTELNNDWDVFKSSCNHYVAHLFNSVKNGAKYTCGMASISAFMYALNKLGYSKYYSNRFNRYKVIHDILSNNFPKKNH